MQIAEPGTPCSRRAAITGACFVAAAALTGCATRQTSIGGSDRSAGGGQGDAGGAAVRGTTSDVPVGGGTVFADQKVVVTQPTAGVFNAFSAVCTHQGCTVRAVVDKVITCPCHASHFDIADGSVVQGPAQQPLPRRKIVVDRTSFRVV